MMSTNQQPHDITSPQKSKAAIMESQHHDMSTSSLFQGSSISAPQKVSSTETVHSEKPADIEPILSAAPEPKPNNRIAWLQVLGYFCLSINAWGIINSYGAFQAFYALSLLSHDSVSQIAWIGSVQAFLMLGSSLFVGPAFDAGYLRTLLWTGSFLTVFGLFMTSIGTALWQLLLGQGVCIGLGCGCLFLPGAALVSLHFRERRSLALGIGSAGCGIGGVVFPVVFGQLQPHVGFGWATRVLAFVILAVAVPPLVVMRYPVGFRAAGTDDSTSDSWFRRLADKIIDRSAFRDRPYMLMNLGLIATYMGMYVVMCYINLFAITKVHSPSNIATNAIVILNATSVFGRIFLSGLADYTGAIHMMVLSAIISLICAASLQAVHSTPGFVAWTAVIGISTGAFMGLAAAGIASISRGGVARIGSRFGISLAVVGIGILIAEPIAGAIFASGGGWPGLIAWCSALLAVGSIGMAASRVLKVGWGFAVRL